MTKIRQLDEHTANMIAAGEVVERPMGVVKELIENAIDAGSTRITISIEEGGLKKLTVSDNGCGMDSEDAQLCFERHATSKIRSQNDLWSIHTLGFRGEALPSIGAVSKVTIRTSDGEESTQVIVAYGRKESVSPYPCSQGTEITVEGLFYHTPARLKHMRSASYESSLIQDVIQRAALSHPDISFRFINDGKDAFRSTGQSDLLEVIYAVFGKNAVENAIECHFEDFDYQVSGYLIAPSITRASRNLMHLFLNGRMVRTYRLYKAVQEGYHGLIPDGRYPLCVLNIEMDPHLLDVNVHPSKWEVRISKEQQLELLLKEGVEKALHNEEVIPEIRPEPVTYFQPISFDQELFETAKEPEVNLSEQKKEEPVQKEPAVQESFAFRSYADKEIRKEVEEDEAILRAVYRKQEEKKQEEEEKIPFPQLSCIGQYRRRFILCETERGLAVVDAHQAKRRIAYEKTMRSFDSSTTMIDLLVPVTLHVQDDLYRRVNEINEAMASVSLYFEPFGDGTLIVRSVPAWLKDVDVQQFCTDLLDSVSDESTKDIIAGVRHKTALAATSHIGEKAVSLTHEEMESLLDQLKNCDNPFTGVSGGNIISIIDDAQLMKGFRL